MTFEIFDSEVKPGEKEYFRIPVTYAAWGSDLYLPLHVYNGKSDGPVLLLMSTIHGKEYPPIRALWEISKKMDPTQIRGTVLILPVANPMAFVQDSRITQEMDIDFGNLGRVFPGIRKSAIFGEGDSYLTDRTLTEIIADVIVSKIYPKVTHYIDFHCHHDGCVLRKTMFLSDGSSLDEKSKKMAHLFGCGIYMKEILKPKTGSGYLGSLGIPGCISEIGGAQFGGALEQKGTEIQIKGIENIMKYLNIIDGSPEVPSKQFYFKNCPKVRPTKSGYLISNYEPEKIYQNNYPPLVKKGDVLGILFDPYSFQELERLVAPVDGLLYMSRRSGPVHAGWHAYGIADNTLGEWL